MYSSQENEECDLIAVCTNILLLVVMLFVSWAVYETIHIPGRSTGQAFGLGTYSGTYPVP